MISLRFGGKVYYTSNNKEPPAIVLVIIWALVIKGLGCWVKGVCLRMLRGLGLSVQR